MKLPEISSSVKAGNRKGRTSRKSSCVSARIKREGWKCGSGIGTPSDSLGKSETISPGAAAKINPPMQRGLGMGSPSGSTPRAGMGPTVDGRVVTLRSFYDAAPEI
ncbi:MAG: hypothetical protein ABSG78_10060 [Verrucomicrobiota bacterium]